MLEHASSSKCITASRKMDSFVVNDLTIKPLSGGFGAEVEGVDFSQPVPQDTIETVRISLDSFNCIARPFFLY